MKVNPKAFKELSKLVSSYMTADDYEVEITETKIEGMLALLVVLRGEDMRGDRWDTKFIVTNSGAVKIAP